MKPGSQTFLRRAPWILCALSCLGPSRETLAQCEVQKLTASDGADGDLFGQVASISGDVALVGAPRQDCAAGPDCGAAYVYHFDGSTWIEQQKLTHPDPGFRPYFASAVAIDNDTAVLFGGAEPCSSGPVCGAAYVYRRLGNVWNRLWRLVSDDIAQSDDFGAALAISGDVIVVGAPLDDAGVPFNIINASGSAYIFRFDGLTWVQEQKLTVANPLPEDFFGHAVAVSGDVAVVATLMKIAPTLTVGQLTCFDSTACRGSKNRS